MTEIPGRNEVSPPTEPEGRARALYGEILDASGILTDRVFARLVDFKSPHGWKDHGKVVFATGREIVIMLNEGPLGEESADYTKYREWLDYEEIFKPTALLADSNNRGSRPRLVELKRGLTMVDVFAEDPTPRPVEDEEIIEALEMSISASSE